MKRRGDGEAQELIPCVGCGALVPDVDGPTFRVPGAASSGCWAVYGEVLAREFGEYANPAANHLTADAYAVQYPGRPTPQTIQSVTAHLISLCLVLKRGVGPSSATEGVRRAIQRFKGSFVWLERPASLGAITVADVVQAIDLADHVNRVERWANAAWNAWSAHHATIHGWVDRLERSTGDA